MAQMKYFYELTISSSPQSAAPAPTPVLPACRWCWASGWASS